MAATASMAIPRSRCCKEDVEGAILRFAAEVEGLEGVVHQGGHLTELAPISSCTAAAAAGWRYQEGKVNCNGVETLDHSATDRR